jgi:hypothetical protein
MDGYESYKRFTKSMCLCGCEEHCNDACEKCKYCKECECEDCLNKRKGYN